MAHFKGFTVLLVAVSLSGVFASPPNRDLITDPVSVEDACSKIDRGASIGKRGINIRITADLISNLRNPELTPGCKQCIAKKYSSIREETIAEIDRRAEEIKTELRTATDSSSLQAIWESELDLLPESIGVIINNCNNDLKAARSDCIASTSASEA